MDQDVFESNVPLRILVGWAEGVSKNDAADIAKGFIQRRFDATDASWYVTAAFMGGFFWEVHEGGKGHAYMPAIIDALTTDPGGQHWFTSGDRIFQVMMRDGKPFGVLLQKSESKKIIESGTLPLRASGKMKRAVFKGTSVAYAGGGLFASSVVFFLATAVMYFFAATPEPAIKDVNLSKLPTSQWEKLAAVKPTEIVSRLEFEAGDWKVEKRPFEIKNLVKAEPPKPEPAAVTPPPPVATEAQPAPPVAMPPAAAPQSVAPEVIAPAPAATPLPLVPGVGEPDPAASSVPIDAPSVPPTIDGAPTPVIEPTDAVKQPVPIPTPKQKAKAPNSASKQKAATQQQKPVASSDKKIAAPQGQKNAVMIQQPSVPPTDGKSKLPTASKRVGKPLSLLPGDVK
jgi:hypothetical protein